VKSNGQHRFQNLVPEQVAMIPDDEPEIRKDALDGCFAARQSQKNLSHD
jgi:hypothetical protein